MKQLVVTFVLALTIGIGVFALPLESRAQTTTISGVTATVAGGNTFSLWSDQTLAAGQTLVLAQNPPHTPTPAFNFDISDTTCGGVACPSAVISGLANGAPFSFTDTNQVLTMKNADPQGFNFAEAQTFTLLGTFTSNGLAVSVSVGYADNLHTNPCGSGATSVGLPGSASCFPGIFDGSGGSTSATFFQGSPQFVPAAWLGTPHAPCTNPAGATPSCWDGAAILFSATPVNPPPPVNLITVTQGGWGGDPHGNNPAAFLAANFSKIGPVVIGCTFKLTFDSASAISSFLPQGGTPGVLTQSATDPTSSDAGVFAGQVLALQLNVAFSSKGLLGSGLGSFVLPSGPAAGKTVATVLADANAALGGCGLPSYVTSISQLNDIVTSINEMFDQ